MNNAQISLSLQFARGLPDAAAHRAALPRTAVMHCIKGALKLGLAQQNATAEGAELTVRVVGAEEGRALNAQYRSKDYATNVLTFDYTSPLHTPPSPWVAADLVLCAPVVAQEAAEQGKTLAAHYAHLIVHGTLHALGFDHETSREDAAAMEALERRILAQLGVADPYSSP